MALAAALYGTFHGSIRIAILCFRNHYMAHKIHGPCAPRKHLLPKVISNYMECRYCRLASIKGLRNICPDCYTGHLTGEENWCYTGFQSARCVWYYTAQPIGEECFKLHGRTILLHTTFFYWMDYVIHAVYTNTKFHVFIVAVIHCIISASYAASRSEKFVSKNCNFMVNDQCI